MGACPALDSHATPCQDGHVKTPQDSSDYALAPVAGCGSRRLEDDRAQASIVVRQPATGSGLHVDRSGWKALHALESARISRRAGFLSRLLVTVLHAPTARVRAARW